MDFYDKECEVKTYGRFSQLPPGSVSPAAWLQRFGEVNADAWLLMQARDKDPEVYGTYWNRFKEVKHYWDTAPDYTSYFGDGLVRYARMFPKTKLAREVGPWVKRVVASQDADGYLGAFVKTARWKMALEVFTTSLMMEVLLYRFETTGERKLLGSAQRAAAHLLKHWRKDGKKKALCVYSGHGAILIRPILKLYALTGRKEYLNFAREQLGLVGRQKAYLAYYPSAKRAKAQGKPVTYDVCANQHNAVESEHVGLPAILYEYDGDKSLLRASEAAWLMMQNHLAFDGTPHGNEGMVHTGPRENCEQCGAVEWLYTSHVLVRTAGDVKYADAAEVAMYNGYPAPRAADAMTLAYMHSPNQLVASQWSRAQFDDPDRLHSAQYYSTAQWPLCCNVNGPRGLPQFVESMVLRSENGKGLAVAYYGPCEARTTVEGAGEGAVEVALRMETEYPFEDEVRVTVSPRREAWFPIEFRIPGWCRSAKVTVNGEAAGGVKPGEYLRIRRRWRPDDRVVLRFDVPIRLETFPGTGIREAGYAVRRGPLAYALDVPARWRPLKKPWKKGPGKRPVSFELFPAKGAAWNFALCVDPKRPEKSFELTRLKAPAGSRPWEHAPIGLKVAARQVQNWLIEGDADHPMTPGLPFKPMKLAKTATTLTLVPFGFTRLRMSFLPLVPGGKK
jgi:DUF1680 family protein